MAAFCTFDKEKEAPNTILAELDKIEPDDFCALEKLLQTGSDSEWLTVIAINECSFLQTLLMYIVNKNSSPDREEQTLFKCISCLVYLGHIHSAMWNVYTNIHGTTDLFQRCLVVLVELIEKSSQQLKVQTFRPKSVPYSGFDTRDIADYNLSYNADDYIDPICDPIDHQTSLRVLLLVLYQIFSYHIDCLIRQLKTERTPDTQNLIDVILNSCKIILISTKEYEEFYLESIKIVAAVNFYFPSLQLNQQLTKFSLLSGQPTEISNLLIHLQTDECGLSFSISEGLLNALNDKGYPNHKDPMAMKYITLCTNLYSTTSYFYHNDTKILIEVILREIQNLSDDDYFIKHKYLVLLGAIFSSSDYFAEAYKIVELKCVLNIINDTCLKVLLRQKAKLILSVLASREELDSTEIGMSS